MDEADPHGVGAGDRPLEQGDRAVEIEPSLGVGNSEMVPVFSGLESGDEIIVSNLRLVSNGQLVRQRAISPEG